MSFATYIGYHGTDFDAANRIEKTTFAINHKHIGWLGTGVYFFENNISICEEYTRHRHKGSIIKILECYLEVPKDKIFDTTLDKDADIFHNYREELKQIVKSQKISLKVSNSNHFDGRVYDLISKRKNIHLVRARTFTPLISDRDEPFPESKVGNAVELCLKVPNYVKTIKRVDNEALTRTN